MRGGSGWWFPYGFMILLMLLLSLSFSFSYSEHRFLYFLNSFCTRFPSLFIELSSPPFLSFFALFVHFLHTHTPCSFLICPVKPHVLTIIHPTRISVPHLVCIYCVTSHTYAPCLTSTLHLSQHTYYRTYFLCFLPTSSFLFASFSNYNV